MALVPAGRCVSHSACSYRILDFRTAPPCLGLEDCAGKICVKGDRNWNGSVTATQLKKPTVTQDERS